MVHLPHTLTACPANTHEVQREILLMLMPGVEQDCEIQVLRNLVSPFAWLTLPPSPRTTETHKDTHGEVFVFDDVRGTMESGHDHIQQV